METLGPRFGTFSRVDDNDLYCDLQAHTLTQDTARHPRHWGWTLWEGRVKVGLFFFLFFCICVENENGDIHKTRRSTSPVLSVDTKLPKNRR